MTNMQDLLGALMKSGPSGSSRQRMEHALGECRASPGFALE
jgi:hypothetical protein